MTNTITHSDLIAQWTRAGAGFSAKPAEKSPDLESLLLETARFASSDARLFTMAATWLCKYGTFIAKHRLKSLIRSDLEPQYRPFLGLLLDIAKTKAKTDRFNAAIAECSAAAEPQPLFEIERRNQTFRKMAERRATEISRKWNLWAAEIELKFDAIRPIRWIIKMNPSYRERAILKGDLRFSILEELRRDSSAGASESELARRCCAERSAIRESLLDLELADLIERVADHNRCSVVLHFAQVGTDDATGTDAPRSALFLAQ